MKSQQKKRTSLVFLLGSLAVLAGVVAFMESLVTVVPWCEYQHHLGLQVSFPVTALLSLAWALVAFRGHRHIIGAMAVLLLVFAAVSVVAVAKEFRRYELAEGTTFDGPDMMGAYRSARQALDASGHGEMVIFALSSYGRKIGGSCGNLQATGPNDSVYGSTGGDGVWTLKRERDGSSAIKVVKHNVAEVLEEVGKRRPDLTNGVYYMNAAWGNPSGAHWYGSAAGKGIWHLSDDFKKFEVWDENGTAVE